MKRESLEDPTLLAVLITTISLARFFVGCCSFYSKATANTKSAEKKRRLQQDKDNFRTLDIAIRNTGRS
jgi:PBP1b-binding outer membrane lipoprotein LpoB